MSEDNILRCSVSCPCGMRVKVICDWAQGPATLRGKAGRALFVSGAAPLGGLRPLALYFSLPLRGKINNLLHNFTLFSSHASRAEEADLKCASDGSVVRNSHVSFRALCVNLSLQNRKSQCVRRNTLKVTELHADDFPDCLMNVCSLIPYLSTSFPCSGIWLGKVNEKICFLCNMAETTLEQQFRSESALVIIRGQVSKCLLSGRG